MTLAELQALLAERGALSGIGTLCRFFDRHRITQEKTAHATGQDRPDVLKRRGEWFDGSLDLDPERLIFINDSQARIPSFGGMIGSEGASTNMARRPGRCWRGERLRSGVPRDTGADRHSA